MRTRSAGWHSRRGVALLLASLAPACAGDDSAGARAGAPQADPPRARPAAGTEASCPEADAGLLDAAYRGDRARVAACLAAGAWIDAVDGGGASALDLAALGGHAEVVRLLLDRGARIVQDAERNSLAAAAREGQTRVVDLLLAAGADPSATWLDKPALHHAIDRHRTEIALDLLDAGADVHAHDGAGRSALAAAVDAGDRTLVQALLVQGADPVEPCPGGSPLDRAEARPDLAAIARRLRAAAAPGLGDREAREEATEFAETAIGEDGSPEVESRAEEAPPELEWPPPPRGRPR